MFSKRPKAYSEQREALQSARRRERMALAKDAGTKKEVLYYLAESDPDPKVRKAVADNPSMPVQVSPILAVDSDVDVRLALAGRLSELLPGLSQDKQSQLYAFAVQSLGTLALDEVLKVRVALSATLKDHAHTPPKIAAQLAKDVEREVSEPILRFCAALADEELLGILEDHPEGWVVEAIAQRDQVSEAICDAVIESENVPAGEALIRNEGAAITPATLEVIVAKAQHVKEWQAPVAARKSLPPEFAKELASFVEASVRDILLTREDFDEMESEEIAAVFRRRVDFAATEDLQSTLSVEERLQQIITDGNLHEEYVSDALAMRDYDLVVAMIAVMASTSAMNAQKIIDMRAPKPIVALAWRAGLSMRLALELQKTIGKVQPKEMLYPKGGTDYPLSEEELVWQVDFLGLRPRK
ncbi:MAG: DUF2336 domain-containing protein [Alphaproteobacteria bacterium]